MGLYGSGGSYATTPTSIWSAPFGITMANLRPFTMFAWVRDGTGVGQFQGTAVSLGGGSGTSIAAALEVNTATPLVFEEVPGITYQAIAGVPTSYNGQWTPIMGVCNTTASRTIYTPSTAPTVDTVSNATAMPFTTIGIGDLVYGGANGGTTATTQLIAEVCIWRGLLGATEYSMLMEGYTPDRIRPNAVQFYFPLRSDVYDYGPARLRMSGPVPVFGPHPPMRPSPSKSAWIKTTPVVVSPNRGTTMPMMGI